MQRILIFFFLLLISATFVSLPTSSIAKSVSHSGKCHMSKEMKIKYVKEAILKSTPCQHKNHSGKCSDCSVSCCQIIVIGFAADITQATQSIAQKVIFSHLSTAVKDSHKAYFSVMSFDNNRKASTFEKF